MLQLDGIGAGLLNEAGAGAGFFHRSSDGDQRSSLLLLLSGDDAVLDIEVQAGSHSILHALSLAAGLQNHGHTVGHAVQSQTGADQAGTNKSNMVSHV